MQKTQKLSPFIAIANSPSGYFFPRSQELRVDSSLFYSWLCQQYGISEMTRAKEIPVVCVGWVCGSQKSSEGPELAPGCGLATPVGLQSCLAERSALPNVAFTMFSLCCLSAGFLHQSRNLQTVHDGKKKSRHWVKVPVCYPMKKRTAKKPQTLKRLQTKGNLQGEGLHHSSRVKAMLRRAESLGGKIEKDTHWLKVVSLKC